MLILQITGGETCKSFIKGIGGSTFNLNMGKIEILERLKQKMMEITQNYEKSLA